ncbi:MAG: glucose 1-dehydrogenase [Bryobacteraceae bacterium]|jgi:NAD(P)-dependent dehydrogenase (short-subunit alcohol dehydrogenase family)
MQSCLDLTDRVAVVVGATSGIGRAIAIGLARHGADVVPTGRRRQEVESACRDVEAAGRRSLRQVADVTQRRSLDALRDAVLERFGRVDILVNAAGYTFRKPTAAMPEDEWTRLIDTDLTGALRACQAFYEPLKASGRGRIVNIASLGSFLGLLETTAYCAAKTALVSLTRSLACEWARDDISVNAIAPGVFPTALNSALVVGTPRGQEFLARTPMRRFGRPEELVGVAVLLASEGASFLTGQCIAVDGGFLASGVNC